MTETKTKEVRLWLLLSSQDLAVAELLIEQQQMYFGIAVYHCQQSVEKGLKAYLTYHDVLFKKTHNLTALLRLCMEFEARFETLLDTAEMLTPYATEFRYPSEQAEPEEAATRDALKLASEAFTLIQQVLPKDLWMEEP